MQIIMLILWKVILVYAASKILHKMSPGFNLSNFTFYMLCWSGEGGTYRT
jgi:hypothetical protein